MTSSPSVGNMPSAVLLYKFTGFFSVSLTSSSSSQRLYFEEQMCPFS